MKYWLIYTHKGRLEAPRAKSFEDMEEMLEWAVARKEELDFIDTAKSIERLG